MATLINDNIISTVADVYGVSVDDILGNSRKQPIAEARQMAMYIYRFRAKYRVIHIAELFHRKHPTVVSALGHLQSLLDVDDKVSDKHKRIMDALWEED